MRPGDERLQADLAASADAARAAQNRSRLVRTGGGIVALLVVVFAINAFSNGSFLTAGNLTNVLRQITYNAILAIGQTFVIITAGIDLSVGSLIELTGVVMASFANAMHFDGPLLVVATLLVGVGVGCLAGLINAIPVVTLNLPPFITTLAMMLMARGLAFKIAHGQPVPLQSGAFTSTGTGFVLSGFRAATGFPGIPIPVVWLAVMVIAFAVLLTRTRFGRYVFAIGGNEEAARLAGIDVKFVKAMVYVISGGCAAIASLLLMAKFSSGSPNTGIGNELQSIAAVVVGGTSLAGGRGSVVTTFFGALLIGLLNNVMNLLNIESYTQDIVLGAVILIAVVVDELRKRYLAR
ncbi:MAG: ABC transporter permease [Candidatus Eremiobacteraeota bacterium]|nr:ABC transporter permease [Candidatus Eremiobacteraeota bacterium]